jgi:hypothetical protein
MLKKISARARLGACALLIGGIFVVVFQPASSIGQASAAGNLPGFNDEFAKLGFKFEGAASCSNAQCHGADEPKEGKGATTLAEFTQWSAGDLHAKAYEQLTGEAGVAIAGKMKIEPTDARCVACHAMPAEEKLQGKDFNIEEGVSCDACHGPSEKWAGPHKEKGWTDKQRTTLKTHDALLKKTGLYDTKSPLARADMCTNCHLAIDADMVEAGHPQPVFELDYFSKSAEKGGIYEGQHWRDPKTPFYNVSLWSTGQVVAVRDAMTQLANRAGAKGAKPEAVNEAMLQAMAHFSAFKPVVASGGVKADWKAWEAQAAKIAAGVKGKKMADVAAGAKAIATEAGKLAGTVSTTKFDKAKTLAILKALLADANTSKMYAAQGMEQQAYAIYSLHNSYNPSKAEGDAASKTAGLIVESLFPPEEGELTPAKFAEGLKAIQAQVK